MLLQIIIQDICTKHFSFYAFTPVLGQAKWAIQTNRHTHYRNTKLSKQKVVTKLTSTHISTVLEEPLPCSLKPLMQNIVQSKNWEPFLKLRENVCGALFTKHNEKPLSRQEFSFRFLRDCLELQGFPSASYNTHSFRIGRATQLSMDNATDAVISNTGRWESAAFKQYIRPAYFTLPKWNLPS